MGLKISPKSWEKSVNVTYIIHVTLFSRVMFVSPSLSTLVPHDILTVNRFVLPNDSRTRKRSPDISFALLAPRATHAACVPMRGEASSLADASPARIYSRAANDTLGHRARWLPSRAERRACGANLSRGVPLAARYTADIVNRSGKWSKRLVESCQRNRITSTGRTRLSESSPQWRRNFNALAAGNSVCQSGTVYPPGDTLN